MDRFRTCSLLFFLFACCIPARSQLCSGTQGAPIFFEDFGSGTALYGPALGAGITTYPYVTGPPLNGSYVISASSDPSGVTGFAGDYIMEVGDHTGNPNGYMMVINSDYAASEVYRKHVTGLCPNTTYVFSAYLSNNDDPNVQGPVCGSSYIFANVKFKVEYPVGTIQGSISTGNLPLSSSINLLNWIQYGFVFTTGPTQTTADVVMVNNAPGGCGNDYVVDDISLSPCGPGITLSVAPNQSSFCPGDSLVLQSAYVSGNYISPQYQWEFSNNNGVTWNTVAGATASNYTINPLSVSQAGMYRLLASENGNIGFANCRIIAGPVTIALGSVSVNSATICAAQNATLTAAGATSYSWSTGATTGSIVVSPSTTTSYTVTSSSGNCPQAVSTVSVIPGSTLSVSGNMLICAGQSTTLNASGSASYSWSNGATASSIVVSPSSATGYTVNSTTGQCSQPAVITVSVNPLPILSITGNTIVCAGNTTTLTATGAGTYAWSTGATTSSVSVSPSSFTNYSVTGTLGTCTAQAVTGVSVVPNPAMVVSGSTSICSGQTATLTAGGATNYNWNTGAVSPSIIVSPLSTTSYSVTGTVSTCTSQAMMTLTVIPSPTVSITGNTVACSGQNTTFTANGANAYAWNTGSSSSGIVVNPSSATSYTVIGTTGTCTNQAVITVTTVGAFITGGNVAACAGATISLTASGSNNYTWSTGQSSPAIVITPSVTTSYSVTGTTGTCTSQAAVTVSITPSPTLAVTGNTLICSGQHTALTASGASTFHWNTGQTWPVITVNPPVTSTYTVTGAVATCTGMAVYTVSVDPSPSASYTVSPNPTDILSPTVYFSNTSQNYTHWLWNFGDGPNGDSVNVNPVHAYNSDVAEVYHTSLTLSNKFGCESIAYATVVVNPAFVFYIPNAFTPGDHDGLNDVFTGQGVGIAGYNIWVYDRWGACIFSSADINKGWDGTYQGKSAMQQDVYAWKVEITDVLHQFHQYFGSVTVLR